MVFGIDDALGIGGGIASLVGGIFAGNAQAEKQKQAKEATDKALKIIQDVGLPPDVAKQIVLEQYKQAGTYTPELEKAVTIDSSALANMKEQALIDNSTREMQLKALSNLSDLNSQYQDLAKQGLNAQDIQALNQLQNTVNQQNQARLATIQQQMQQRGQGGSGAEVAAMLSSAQQAANQQSQSANELAAQQQQRKLAALQAMSGLAGQEANLAGNLRSSDFNISNQMYQQAMERAKAQDVLNQFNAGQLTGAQSRNVGAQNQGQMYNLNNAQRIADTNVTNANNELYRQNEAEKWKYGQKGANAQAQANALTGQAANLTQQGVNQAQSIATTAAGVGGAMSAYGDRIASQNDKLTARNDRLAAENAAQSRFDRLMDTLNSNKTSENK